MVGLARMAWLLAISISMGGALAHAESLNAGERLRKLSLSLRGTLPSNDEYSQLLSLKDPEASENFLRQKSKSYIDSKAFQAKFFERVMDGFRFNINSDMSTLENESSWRRYFYASFGNTSSYVESAPANSFAKVLRANLSRRQSWDQLMAHPEFFASMEILEAQATFSANLEAFEKQVAKIQREFNLSEDEAIRISLGLQKLPEKNENVARVLGRVRELDPTAASRAAAVTDAGARSALLNLSLFQLRSQKKISDAEFDELKKAIGTAATATGTTTKEYQLFGTQHSATKGNFELYKRALADRASGQSDEDKWRDMIARSAINALNSQEASTKALPGIVGSAQYGDRFRQTQFSPSAALFNIYLCDEMKPVALGGVDLSLRAVRGIAPLGSAPSQNSASVLSIQERHASDPKCQGCHRKLDPVQDIYNRTAEISAANPLTFVYDDESGQEHRVQISSYAELMPTIQKQRAYKVCQVRRFWNWYIGSDIPLVGKNLEDMIATYDRASGVQELVETLVNRPEFTSVPKPDELITFEAVKPLLSRCNGCHNSEPDVASFTSLPFSLWGDHSEHPEWIKKIAKMTDVMRGARGAKMPPANAGWRLEEEQITLLSRWLANGATDSAGRPTISSGLREEILHGASPEIMEKIEDARQRQPLFGSYWSRYLEGRDFMRVLMQLAPEQMIKEMPSACTQLVNSSSAFGFPERTNGKPNSRKPTFNFLTVWSSCLAAIQMDRTDFEKFATRLTGSRDIEEVYRLSGGTIKIPGSPSSFYESRVRAIRFGNLPEKVRQEIIGRMALQLLGQGIGSRAGQIAREIDSTMVLRGYSSSFPESLRDLTILIMSRDEFLSF